MSKIGDLLSGLSFNLNIKSRKQQSIKSKTKDLILQYPMLFSSGLSYNTAELLSRSLEHEYASLMVVLLKNTIINAVNDDDSAADVLKKYHTNMGSEDDDVKKDMEDYLNKWFNENYVFTKTQLTEACREMLTTLEESYNTKNLNDMSFPTAILEDAKILDEEGNEVLDESGKISLIEYKKLNNAVPTFISLDLVFKPKSKNGENTENIRKTITFGVKGVVHPLLNTDIQYYLNDSIKNKSKLFKLIRFTTGELKFFRDIIFNVNYNKKLANDAASKNNFWWKRLSTLASKNRGKQFFIKGNEGIIPTATMIISKEDVDVIKSKSGVDILSSPSYVKKFYNNFYLLTFIVADESTNLVHIFNEQLNTFDVVTFDALKRTAEQNDIETTETKPGLFK